LFVHLENKRKIVVEKGYTVKLRELRLLLGKNVE